MRRWQFVIEVHRDRAPSDVELGWLFARCADLSVEASPRRQRTRVSVDRVALSLVDAVVSAVRDLEMVGLPPAVVVVDDDDLVTDDVRVTDEAGMDPTLTAINLALRLRALAPRVERLRTIRSLIAG